MIDDEADKDVLALLIKKGDELVGMGSWERESAAMTLYACLGDRARASGSQDGCHAMELGEKTGRAMDMAASKAFYGAIFGVLKIPIGGSDERNFWADEPFPASLDSEDLQGEPTGRHHMAFQAQDRAMVDAFASAAQPAG